jgi:hypothetical protein
MECYYVPGLVPLDQSKTGKTFYKARHHNQDDFQTGGLKFKCHLDNAEDTPGCRLLGPDKDKVFKILGEDPSRDAAEFPIFRIVAQQFEEHRRVVGVTVERWGLEYGREIRKPGFAAISHVWSQGMGNAETNELYECQLEIILTSLEAAEQEQNGRVVNHLNDDKVFRTELLDQILDGYDDDNSQSNAGDGRTYSINDFKLSSPFWMDTLAIPVKKADEPYPHRDFQKLKQSAIRQIYDVYNMASRVIVIDKKLYNMETQPSEPSQILIGLLTSDWMQRLWTLQEAFLSRGLYVAFKGEKYRTQFHTHEVKVELENVDKCIRTLGRQGNNAYKAAIAELIQRIFFNNLMGEDREIRNRNDHPIETRGSMVISSAWKASRWRASNTRSRIPITGLTRRDYTEHLQTRR